MCFVWLYNVEYLLKNPSVPEEASTLFFIIIALYNLGLHNEDTLPLVMLDLFFSKFYFIFYVQRCAPYFNVWLQGVLLCWQSQLCASRAGPAISAQVLIVIAGGLFAAYQLALLWSSLSTASWEQQEKFRRYTVAVGSITEYQLCQLQTLWFRRRVVIYM